LLNGAPDALNSLNELAIALNSDASFGFNAYGKIASSDASINLIRNNLNNNYYTITNVDTSVNTLKTYTDKSLNTNYYTKTYVDTSFSNIVTNSLITTGSGTIKSGGGFIGTSYQPSSAETAITFGNNIISGNIDIGAAQTSGNLNLGLGSRTTAGNIFIGTGTGATNTINIGTGNVISIVNATTPTLSISRPIQPTYAGNAPNANTMIGFIATPTISGITNITTGIANIGQFSLTTGTWIVQAKITFTGVSVVASQFFRISFSTTSAAHGNLIGDWNQDGQSGTVNINYSTNFQLTATTTIYCIGICKTAGPTTFSILVNAIRVA